MKKLFAILLALGLLLSALPALAEDFSGMWYLNLTDVDLGYFQFNEDGKFCEDNIFYGYYSVDEEASTIKLMYDEPLQDALLYYRLNGNELTIDYPWTLVPLTKKDTAVVETGTEKGK